MAARPTGILVRPSDESHWCRAALKSGILSVENAILALPCCHANHRFEDYRTTPWVRGALWAWLSWQQEASEPNPRYRTGLRVKASPSRMPIDGSDAFTARLAFWVPRRRET